MPQRSGFPDITWRQVVLLALIGSAAMWLTSSPDGVSGRVDTVWRSINEYVTNSFGDPDLRRAAEVYNDWFTRSGSYPRFSEAQMRDQPEVDWGLGVTVSWCSPRHVVLRSVAAKGTVSRLIIDGKVHGDVDGRAQCPPDLVNLAPWPSG